MQVRFRDACGIRDPLFSFSWSKRTWATRLASRCY